MGKAITKTRPEPNFDLKEPPMFKVIYINDNVTTMEFVVSTLETIFNYGAEDAAALTTKIHEDGSAVVAILPFEIAEQKGVEVTQLARNNGYPLLVKLEPAE